MCDKYVKQNGNSFNSIKYARRNVKKLLEFFEERTQGLTRTKSTPNLKTANEKASVDNEFIDQFIDYLAENKTDPWKVRKTSLYKKNDKKQITPSQKRPQRFDTEDMLNWQFSNLGFTEAEEEGCTEAYRKSLIVEMDLEVAKMKSDGFIEEDQDRNSSFDEPPAQYRKSLIGDFDLELKRMKSNGFIEADQNDCVYQNSSFDEPPAQNVDLTNSDERYLQDTSHPDREKITQSHNSHDADYPETNDFDSQPNADDQPDSSQRDSRYSDEDFGQSCLLDGDNQEYMVEAYNDDDQELVKSYLQIVRMSVVPDGMKRDEFSAIVFESEETPVSSGRNTRYSTASVDSNSSDRMDEGIVLEPGCNDDFVGASRRETVVDDEGVVRITRFLKPTQSNAVNSEDRGTLRYIFDEIKQTEKKYVKDLRKIVIDYKFYVELNSARHGTTRVGHVFGNIGKIYRRQIRFLRDLDKCSNVKCIVEKFIEYESLFELYPQYFKNKPRADATLKQYAKWFGRRQRELDDRLDISAYLLTPLQRLGKYKLFLENILKNFEKNGDDTSHVKAALDIIRREMQRGNDLLALESIIDNPLRNQKYGSFIRREKFNCVKPRKNEITVFLFREIVIFTVGDQKNIEQFHYWISIKMSDLRIATYEEDLNIHLTDFSKSKRKLAPASKYTIVLEAKDEKLKETWRKEIEDILWNQLEQVKAKTLQRFRKEPVNKLQEIKTGSSTFYQRKL